MNDIIKTCPHCGGAGRLNANYSYKTRSYFIFVKCDICGSTGKTYGSREDPQAEDWNTPACDDAISAWNMRNGQD